ncbi:FAD-binding oxidoreductase [Vallitalea okinawensis]|uniref:FAD-binding oxidoreductase n=1 Tax=Vallitalea okinawensis TaxID=2078660 RepID=UPI000CFC2CAB|nr:FAD-binding oxidoreductase [Vallitalea okinawensis]
MKTSKEQIIDFLTAVVGKGNVITEQEVLVESSLDRFRRYEKYHGRQSDFMPSCVCKVHSAEEVSEILKYANENLIPVIPRTGESATEGGLEVVVENTIVLDGSEMNEIIEINEENMLATVACGVPLEVLENKLREKGYTTGHSPQSKPLAQFGGLVATRSIGQFSTLYGGIEDMVVGLEAVFPSGDICKIKNVPRRAAGPDIRHIIIGNEGAVCFITEVTVKIFKYHPENNQFMGFLLDDMRLGFSILREVMVEGYKPSVARLYDEEDGEYHFSHFADGRCVLIFVAEGNKHLAKATADGIREILVKYSELEEVNPKLIENWFNHLNWDPQSLIEERKETLETNNICHTTEVSGNWDVICDIFEAGKKRIKEKFPDVTLMGGHSSHSYLNGTNMYFVYFYNVECPVDEELKKYHLAIKEILVEETLKRGGSMCHHHGVGKHRSYWIKDEYQSSYYMLENLIESFDPNNIMNPGTILGKK